MAKPNEQINVNGTTPIVYKKVFLREIQNVSSDNMRVKFCIPTNSGVLKESHFIKAKINEKTTGTKVKIKNPIKFGAINDQAIIVFLRFNLREADFVTSIA